jgi:hypothetical protein
MVRGVKRLLALAITASVLSGCSGAGAFTGSTTTPAPARAVVTDTSVPFAASESNALVGRGFLGQADFGRIGLGCTVEVLKTTDRAAQVKLLSCPSSSDMNTARTGLTGWVARSALDIR